MSSHVWQVQEAKSRFSELMDEAILHGPQVVTRHGKKTVVVVSFEEHRHQAARQKPLSRLFQDAPTAGAELDFSRDRSPARKVLEL